MSCGREGDRPPATLFDQIELVGSAERHADDPRSMREVLAYLAEHLKRLADEDAEPVQ